MTRALILTADAGFGHRSAANAIAAALVETEPHVHVDVVNALEHPSVPRSLRDSQTDYDRIVRDAPSLYRFGYRATDDMLSGFLIENGVIPLLYEALRETVRSTQPDVILCTWPLYQAPLQALFMGSTPRVPVITVVTDLASVHRLWFHNVADALVVPTEVVRQLALGAGIPDHKIRVIGIPVSPRLGRRTTSRERLRAQLGWQPGLRTIFAVGSARVPNLANMLAGLNHSGLPIQLVLSAGKSQSLLTEFRLAEWHVPVRLYPFVEDMPTLLHASDILICKAGGLITTEALAAGLPLILVDVIPGQEEGNARFVVDGGAGEIAQSPIAVLEHVFHWLQDNGAGLERGQARAAALGRPDAAREVALLALNPSALRAAQRDESTSGDDTLTQWLRRMGFA